MAGWGGFKSSQTPNPLPTIDQERLPANIMLFLSRGERHLEAWRESPLFILPEILLQQGGSRISIDRGMSVWMLTAETGPHGNPGRCSIGKPFPLSLPWGLRVRCWGNLPLDINTALTSLPQFCFLTSAVTHEQGSVGFEAYKEWGWVDVPFPSLKGSHSKLFRGSWIPNNMCWILLRGMRPTHFNISHICPLSSPPSQVVSFVYTCFILLIYMTMVPLNFLIQHRHLDSVFENTHRLI